jgi:hypothetical protein
MASIALLAGEARAQIDFSGGLAGPGTIVFDPTAVGQLLEQVGVSQEQLTQLVTTYQEIVQVYGMATKIWNSVNELVGANQWAPGLQVPGLLNPLPFAAANSPGWIGGFNDPTSLPFGSQYLSQNTVGGDFTVFQDGTFAGNELLKAIRTLSSMQAVASNHLGSIETRIAGLTQLFQQLANIGTLQETDSLSARLNSELNYATSQEVQAQQVMSAAQLQLAVLENNQRQWQYQDEGIGIKNACSSVAAAGGTIAFAACH